jgi:Tol biopolymer transport system component
VIAAAAAVTILVIGPALWMRGPDRPPDRSQWIQLTNFPGSVSGPALSPDGRTLAFVRGPEPRQIYVKMLPDGQPVQLTHDSFDKGSLAFHWDTWAVPVFGGEPKLLLKNASGLVWTGPRQVLFSDKTGLHMGIVAAEESRIGQRDIYLPAHEHAMAHKSQLSPDRKWVLLVEMDQDHQWLPCRMVPFDGRSSGRPVGPPRAGCTSGAWSPDGKWMYVSSDAGGAHHIWRQRFPDGRPEQVTSGPTEEKSIAMAPDGRSFVTAVALSNVGIWVHDASSDQLISMDGNSVDPKFTRDGRRLYYRVVKKTPTAGQIPGAFRMWRAGHRGLGPAARSSSGLRGSPTVFVPTGMGCGRRSNNRRIFYGAFRRTVNGSLHGLRLRPGESLCRLFLLAGDHRFSSPGLLTAGISHRMAALYLSVGDRLGRAGVM